MRIPISTVCKNLDVQTFQLHQWEKRGWLGSELVIKDPENNNQRIYTEQQVERIEFIYQEIQDQKAKGIKRTDFAEMESKLLEKFGGEVKSLEKHEISVLPASLETFQQIMIQQNKEIVALRDTVNELKQRQLPEPKDYSADLEKMKRELEESKEREEKLLAAVEKLQSTVTERVDDKEEGERIATEVVAKMFAEMDKKRLEEEKQREKSEMEEKTEEVRQKSSFFGFLDRFRRN